MDKYTQDMPAFQDCADDGEVTPADADSLLHRDEEIPTALSVFKQVDKGIEDEISEDDDGNFAESESSPSSTEPEDVGGTSQRGGERLNNLHGEYVKNPSKENLDVLLSEVLLYSAAICKKTCLKFDNPEIIDYILKDVAAVAATKVWMGLPKFDGKSKFSVWAYTAVERATIDALNKVTKRRPIDNPLVEGVDEAAPPASEVGSRNSGGSGTAPDDSGEASPSAVVSQEHLESNEAVLNAELDYEKVLARLCANDRLIIQMYQMGHSPQEIGKRFDRDAKWASNQLVRLKQLVAHELYIAETILHTCLRDLHSVTTMEVGKLYAEDGVDFRALSMKCKCRKGLTGLEAKKMIEKGEASLLYKLGADGKPVEIVGEIWAAQSVRTPRVGLSSSRAHVEKAYGIGGDGLKHVARNIDLEHEITLTERAKLVREVPAAEYDVMEREQSGRAAFTNFKEERSNPKSDVCLGVTGGMCDGDCAHCVKETTERAERERLRALPPKHPTTVIEENAVCPKCHELGMVVSEYADGCINHKHECGGRWGGAYLQVFKPRNERRQRYDEVRVEVAA